MWRMYSGCTWGHSEEESVRFTKVAKKDMESNQQSHQLTCSLQSSNVIARLQDWIIIYGPYLDFYSDTFQVPHSSGSKTRATYHCRWRSECRPSLSVISAAFMAFGKSCLLAKTSSTASRSSSCDQSSILISTHAWNTVFFKIKYFKCRTNTPPCELPLS